MFVEDETPYAHMSVSENSGFSPQIIHVNRVFHYFHHPILGAHPYFWKTPIWFAVNINVCFTYSGFKQLITEHWIPEEKNREWWPAMKRLCWGWYTQVGQGKIGIGSGTDPAGNKFTIFVRNV